MDRLLLFLPLPCHPLWVLPTVLEMDGRQGRGRREGREGGVRKSRLTIERGRNSFAFLLLQQHRVVQRRKEGKKRYLPPLLSSLSPFLSIPRSVLLGEHRGGSRWCAC